MSYLKRFSALMVLFLLILVIPLTLLKFFFYLVKDERNEKVALILDENIFSPFNEYFKDYTVIFVTNKTVAEILILNITKEIFNMSFYAPIIILLEGRNSIKGVIVGKPSNLFWEEIQFCVNSLNCTPFLAYAVHVPKCDYCPRSSYHEKIEILTKLSTERSNKLVSIVRSFLKN